MKITYVASVRIPSERAAGIHIMKMCEAFARKNIDVTLVVPWRFARIKEDPFVHYGVRRTFSVRRLFTLDTIALEPLLGKLAFWIRTFIFRFSLWVYQLQNRNTLYYSRDWFLVPKGGVLELHKFPSTVTRWHRSAWNRARLIVVISQALKNDLVDEGVSEHKVLLAPDAVDLDLFPASLSQKEAREKLTLPQNRSIVLYAGSVLSWKGVDIFIQTSSLWIARNEKPDKRSPLFVVVGGRNDQIDHIKENNPSSDNVLFAGLRPHQEIPAWLSAADVVVLPNKKGSAISERYTSPLKLFEYMASGRSVVASDLPSIREIINEDVAVLVEPNNSQALLEGITWVLDHREESHQLAVRAQEKVSGRTWDARAELIINTI